MKKNFVSNSQESTRMFKNDFLESMSKMHYTLPLIIFLPVIGYFTYATIIQQQVGWLQFILLLVGGVLVWSLVEYIMHRFLFHYQPTSERGKRLHFIFHGVHHDYPNDAKRLVMAPSVSIPLAVIYYFLFKWILGQYFAAPFFVGFVLGYLFYDMTHYAIHHANFKSGLWMRLKRHHMIHHYKDGDNGYGVSSKLWDVIFKTDFGNKNGAD